MIRKIVFRPDSDSDATARLIGGLSLAYVLVLALLLLGGVLLRLHLDGASGPPVAPLGFRGGWFALSA